MNEQACMDRNLRLNVVMHWSFASIIVRSVGHLFLSLYADLFLRQYM